MDSFNNPFSKLNIHIINANPEIITLGIEKIVVVFNKKEITNFSQFVERLNEIYEDYGIVQSIYNKEGFKIIEFNKLHINNIWNYIANNDTIQISLNYQKEEFKENKNENLIKYSNIKEDIFYKDNNSKTKNKSYLKNLSKNEKISANKISSTLLDKNNISEFYINKKNKKKNILDTSSSNSEHSELSLEFENNNNKTKNNTSINSKNIVKPNIKKEVKLTDFYNDSTASKNLLGKKRKVKSNTKENSNNININKIKETNHKSQSNVDIKKLNYKLIPSDKLDDVPFLNEHYAQLFLPGTNIKFKIQELLKTGIGVGDYHFGVVDNYNPENNSFLIKDCNSLNEKTKLFMYQSDDENLMCIELKNFVEIWIETEKNGKNYLEKDSELTKHFIRRQVEYYFCDKNYEKDNFLKKNEDENGFIPLNVIMGFNKIQMITKDKNEFIEALKEDGNENLGEDKIKSYEFNQDFSKIRKIK